MNYALVYVDSFNEEQKKNFKTIISNWHENIRIEQLNSLNVNSLKSVVNILKNDNSVVNFLSIFGKLTAPESFLDLLIEWGDEDQWKLSSKQLLKLIFDSDDSGSFISKFLEDKSKLSSFISFFESRFGKYSEYNVFHLIL